MAVRKEMMKTRQRPRDKAFNELLGRNVRERREARGMTQAELGELLGVTAQQVQKYERGESQMAASRFYNAAKVFNVPMELLAGGVDTVSVADEVALVVRRVSDAIRVVGRHNLVTAQLFADSIENAAKRLAEN